MLYGIGKQNNELPEDTSSRHLCLINYDERTSTSTLTLSYPLLGPSRHVRVYYSMPQSSPSFFCSYLFYHETFRPLFHRLAPFPLVLGCSRLLVGVGTKSSEVVQETPYPLFSLPLHAARAPHSLRQSGVLHACHKSGQQNPPPAHNHLDALTSQLHEGVQIVHRVVGAILFFRQPMQRVKKMW